MTMTFLGVRARATGESGVVRAFSDEQAERLAAASAPCPRNSGGSCAGVARSASPGRGDSGPRGVRDEQPGGTRQTPATKIGDRTPLSFEPLSRSYNAGHEPPKTPVVEGLGLWSWMLPPPPAPPPSVCGKVPSSGVA